MCRSRTEPTGTCRSTSLSSSEQALPLWELRRRPVIVFALFVCLYCTVLFALCLRVCVFPSVGAVRHLDKSEPSAVVFYCYLCVPVRLSRSCPHQFAPRELRDLSLLIVILSGSAGCVHICFALLVARYCICSCPGLTGSVQCIVLFILYYYIAS